MDMIKNYLHITMRIMRRNLSFSLINILGLAIGMATFILISLWVLNEKSYDTQYPDSENTYRVYTLFKGKDDAKPAGVTTPAIIAPLKEFPEVKSIARLISFKVLANSDVLLKKDNQSSFYESNGYMADSTFFDIFPIPFQKGDAKSAFSEPFSIMISSELAEKYFGKDEPIGKVLKLDNYFDLKVSGVFTGFPKNSHLKIDFIVPITLLKRIGQSIDDNWNYLMLNTYIKLDSKISAADLEKKIRNIHIQKDPKSEFELGIQPIQKIHLYSAFFDFDIIVQNAGDIKYVTIFSIIAIFILLIASINFMNLSTARASRRSKEVGIRKVVGSDKFQLIRQFLGESIFMVFIANILAMILVEFALPYFNEFTGKELALNYSNPWLYVILTGFIVITGIISGIYPAFFLSSFQPVKVLKNAVTSGKRGAAFRKTLVIFQFTIVVFLTVCTIFVYLQSRFLQNKKIGIDKEQVFYFARRGALYSNFDAFKSELLTNPAVNSVCLASDLPVEIRNQESGVTWEGKRPDETAGFAMFFGDYDVLKTFNIQILQGRGYSPEFPADQESSFIINETAVKRMGLKEPIGAKITVLEKKGTIIGVVKDFNFAPLYKPISPMIILYRPMVNMIFVKFNHGNINQHIKFLENVYKKFNPDFPSDFKYLDQTYLAQYKNEQRTGKLLSYFTLFGIAIACLGLLGLVNFFSIQRTKEIGIRKTHGAGNMDIVNLMSSQFAKWVLIANVIACPLAYFAVQKWLEQFAFKIEMVLWPFLVAAAISFMFTLATILYQTVKAANKNPVDSLKYE